MRATHLFILGHSERFKQMRGRVRLVRNLLEMLASITSMKLIEIDGVKNPIVIDTNLTEDGVTGVALIQESHIAMHTWAESGCFRFTLDSCKEFDPEYIKAYLVNDLYCSFTKDVALNDL